MYDELDKSGWKEKDPIEYEEGDMDVQKEIAILAQRPDDAIEKGREESKTAEKMKLQNLLNLGMSVDVISQSTSLSIGGIKNLQEENTH